MYEFKQIHFISVDKVSAQNVLQGPCEGWAEGAIAPPPLFDDIKKFNEKVRELISFRVNQLLVFPS